MPTSVQQGVFCANYWIGRGHYPPCQGVWHAKCFLVHEDPYPVKKLMDEEGFALVDSETDDSFMTARPGDQFMTRFQCPLCHFRNIYGRDPIDGNGRDKYVLRTALPRAILDAFWSRRPLTVQGNKSNLLQLVEVQNRLGMGDCLPAFGPFPLQDIDGMSVAIAFLERSLAKGKNANQIQYSTARRIRSAHSNAWNVSVMGEETSVSVAGKAKTITTTAPTSRDWYSRFDKGAHERMGDLVIQDAVWTPELMVAIMEEFELDWVEVESRPDRSSHQVRLVKKDIVLPALMGLLSYVVALRGEELPLMEIRGTANDTQQGKLHSTRPHGVISLVGRFKNMTGYLRHKMPVPMTTDSGLEPAKWIERMIDFYAEAGILNGPVFRTESGKRARFGVYEGAFFDRMERVYDRLPGLFPKTNMSIREEYSLRRSGRRSATSRAVNVGLDDRVTNTNNRWRATERARGKVARGDMIEHYTDVVAMLDSLLAFPQAM